MTPLNWECSDDWCENEQFIQGKQENQLYLTKIMLMDKESGALSSDANVAPASQ
jgi:hypothetical protein